MYLIPRESAGKKLQILKDSKEFGNQSRLADEILMALNNPEMIGHYHTKSRSQDRNENKIWFKEQERKRKSFIDMFSAVPKFHISNGLVESVVHSSFQNPVNYYHVFLMHDPLMKKCLLNGMRYIVREF